MLFLVLLIFIILGVCVLFTFRAKKEKQNSWLQFYAKGKDAGFSFKEIELLRRLAIKSNLAEPSALFWSQNQLDLCIRSLVRSSRLAGSEKDADTQEFLSKLYDYRKKIEMEKPKVKNGISSSLQIGESQTLRLLLNGAGVFKSQVIKNIGPYLTIARPSSVNLPQGFPWIGQRVSVYFWREDDAGYVFDTDVLDEVYSKGRAALKLAHSESLFRTQKRKSVRIKTHKPAYLYLIGDEEDAEKIEVKPGLKCIIEDLSDSGCAVTIGGKAKPGIRVKLQFALEGAPLVMSGTVRSSEYREESNRSLLHIEADPLEMETRNHILGEVFGMLSDDEEPLPFRVLDEEIKDTDDRRTAQDNALYRQEGL
jgi:c-di-GMP-binding flagellar brake protein YcgR